MCVDAEFLSSVNSWHFIGEQLVRIGLNEDGIDDKPLSPPNMT